MTREELIQSTQALSSFPAAIAALCIDASFRGATYIEVEFKDNDKIKVRDDGRAFTHDERDLIQQIAAGKPTPNPVRWDAENLFGFIHFVYICDFFSWDYRPLDECQRPAHHLRVYTHDATDDEWLWGIVPSAPNNPPAHGVEIGWEGNLRSSYQQGDAFRELERAMASHLAPEITAKVRLRIPSLHGVHRLKT